MGKGSGECARPALSLSGTESASTVAAEQFQHAHQWQDVTDETVLANALNDARGLDRWVIQEQLRRVRGGVARDYGWESFTWTDTVKSAAAHPGQLHPIFTHGGLAADGVLYMEQHRVRQPGEGTNYYLGGDISISPYFDKLPSELKPPKHIEKNAADYMSPHGSNDSWKQNWVFLLQTPIETTVAGCAGDKPTAEELFVHFDTYVSGSNREAMWAALSDDEKLKITTYLANKAAQSTRTGTKTKHWRFTEENQWRVQADITPDDEAELIEALIGAGATVQEREIEVPEYTSVHDVEGGKAYYLTVDGGEIEYVPHYSVGTAPVTHTKYRVGWQPSAEQLDELRNKTESHFKYRKHSAEEMVTRVRVRDDGSLTAPRIMPLSALDKDLHDDIEAAIDSGEAISVTANGKKSKEQYSRPTDEDIKKTGVYVQVGDQWMWQRHADNRDKQLKAIDAMDKEWKWSFDRTDTTEKPRFHATPKTDQEQEQMRAWQALEGHVRGTAKKQSWPPGVLRLMTDSEGNLRQELSTETRSVTRRETVEHTAPMSERGVIRVSGVAPQQAARSLHKLGVSGTIEREVPWNLIYEDGPRRGRVIPFLDDYITGEKALTVPDDRAILHGMTGVQNDAQAIERLTMMVNSGGLKSIAERRRAGLASASSISPRGDIASGIDRGVPCKIGHTPSFGSHVIFGMKQDVLARRDCWFSDQDFGGGHNRYDSYNSYAAGIGQGKMHQPPSPDARQYHYDNGLHDSNNEMYLTHEIPWHHVDTVYVNKGTCATVIKEKMKEWKAAGLVPPSLNIVSFDGDHSTLAPKLKERIAAAAATSIWKK